MSVQTTRLLVLGIVRLRQPTYGYDIEREIKAWNADRWAGIARASVYNQLRSLVKAGKLEFDSVSKSGNRPNKYLYRITQAGEQEFHTLLRGILNNGMPQPLDMLPLLCFLPSLTKQEIVDGCNTRLRIIGGFLDSFDEQMARWFPEGSDKQYLKEIFLLEKEAFIAERKWLEGFLVRINEGQYRFDGSQESGGRSKRTHELKQ